MKTIACSTLALLLLSVEPARARGVSPYLPLNLDPEVEHQIARVLILADKPVLSRPIAAATVRDALPKACARDVALCEDVTRYLNRHMRRFGVTHASAEGISAGGSSRRTVPNAYGRTLESKWEISGGALWQPTDHVLLSVGGVAYEGEANPSGSVLSLGWDRAQLDMGYRPHWLSPMTDSSMLIGTQAATMPSVTLSNYALLTRLGVRYELFLARMSTSDRIAFRGGFTGGRPLLSGTQLSIEPVSGWALGVNRLLQFGGGRRKTSFGNVLNAFIDPARFDNADAAADSNAELGNQLASLTSSFIFPGRVPFAVNLEYAGEDTSNGKNYLLGNSSISIGITLPRLWHHFDFTYEASDWQNGWYVHHIYQDGLRSAGHVLGSWFGDERLVHDSVGGESQMARLGWYPPFGGSFELRYRMLKNASYTAFGYDRGRDLSIRYSRPLGRLLVGGEVFAGRDVFGARVAQAGLFARLGDGVNAAMAPLARDDDDPAEIFVAAGTSVGSVDIHLDKSTPKRTAGTAFAPYVGIGARRAVSGRSNLGARLEITEADGHRLLAFRAIDYRYRPRQPLAISAFMGAARYDLATSAQGLYVGLGAEWRDIMKGWSLGVDASCAFKVARDHLLPDEFQSAERPDSFYDIYRGTISLTRRF